MVGSIIKYGLIQPADEKKPVERRWAEAQRVGEVGTTDDRISSVTGTIF